MKQPTLRFSTVFLGGLVLISLGFASSLGLQPTEAIVPLFAVVGGLAAIAAASGGGPRSLL
jgi:hypothetical protein